MLQFLIIRGLRLHQCALWSSVGTFCNKLLEGKVKPSIANPKANIGDIANNGDEAQTITNENMPMQGSRIC